MVKRWVVQQYTRATDLTAEWKQVEIGDSPPDLNYEAMLYCLLCTVCVKVCLNLKVANTY